MTHPVDLSLAGSDMQHIVQSDPIVQKLFGGQIVARQLLMLFDKAITDHLANEYELAHPAVVLELLQAAALHRAASTPCPLDNLRTDVLTVILPLVDIFCKMEEDHAKAKQETVSRNDTGSSDELGAVLHSPDSPE